MPITLHSRLGQALQKNKTVKHMHYFNLNVPVECCYTHHF